LPSAAARSSMLGVTVGAGFVPCAAAKPLPKIVSVSAPTVNRAFSGTGILLLPIMNRLRAVAQLRVSSKFASTVRIIEAL
jgi:hypothetical protein